MLAQIRQNAFVVDDAALPGLQAEFAVRHCVLLRQLFEPALLARLLERLSHAVTTERTHGAAAGLALAKELCVERGALVVQAFVLLLNNPQLFRLIERLTGCARIGSFRGRVYLMQPSAGHYDSWHSDVDGNRLIGLSLNLSQAIYSGGLFQLRERDSMRLVAEIANHTLGDAHLFRIASGLEHRVTEVTGDVTKVALAGWFQALPEFGGRNLVVGQTGKQTQPNFLKNPKSRSFPH